MLLLPIMLLIKGSPTRQCTSMSNQSIKFVMASYPDPLVINPLSEHTQSIILLHDRAGSNRHFALELLEATDGAGNTLQQALPGMKFIFPTALKQPSAVLDGYPIASWFDCLLPIDPHETSKRQAEGLKGACLMVHPLLDTEVAVVGNWQCLSRRPRSGLCNGTLRASHIQIKRWRGSGWGDRTQWLAANAKDFE